MFTGRGNYYRRKRVLTTDQARQIDIRLLKRQGLLSPGTSGELHWNINGDIIGSVIYTIAENKLTLWHQLDSHQLRQDIKFDLTPCNYGGYRKWLLCPACSHRVTTLYTTSGYFLCRHCHRLPYRSSNETKRGRQMLKKHKIGNDIFDYYQSGQGWGKKSGIHWKTFCRLKKIYDQLELTIYK